VPKRPRLVAERLDRLNQRLEEMRMLRDELAVLLSKWDRRLAGTAEGKRAHLLESLGDSAVIERNRRGRVMASRRSVDKPRQRRSPP